MRISFIFPHSAMLEEKTIDYWFDQAEELTGTTKPSDIILPAVTADGIRFASSVHSSAIGQVGWTLHDWLQYCRKRYKHELIIWAYIDPTLRFLNNDNFLCKNQFGFPIRSHFGGRCCIVNPLVSSIVGVLVKELAIYVSEGLGGIAFDLSDLYPHERVESSGRPYETGFRNSCFCAHCCKQLQKVQSTFSREVFIGQRNPLRLVMENRNHYAVIPTRMLKAPTEVLLSSLAAQSADSTPPSWRSIAKTVDQFIASPPENNLDLGKIQAVAASKIVDEHKNQPFSPDDQSNSARPPDFSENLDRTVDARTLQEHLIARAEVVADSVKQISAAATTNQIRTAGILRCADLSIQTMTDLSTLLEKAALGEYWCPTVDWDYLDEKRFTYLEYLFASSHASLGDMLSQMRNWLQSGADHGLDANDLRTFRNREVNSFRFVLLNEMRTPVGHARLSGYFSGIVSLPFMPNNVEKFLQDSGII